MVHLSIYILTMYFSHICISCRIVQNLYLMRKNNKIGKRKLAKSYPSSTYDMYEIVILRAVNDHFYISWYKTWEQHVTVKMRYKSPCMPGYVTTLAPLVSDGPSISAMWHQVPLWGDASSPITWHKTWYTSIFSNPSLL